MIPHGIYSIELIHKILFVEAAGPFNDVAVSDYRRDMKKMTEKLASSAWALCAVFSDESLFTPEAEAGLTALTQWRQDKGMEAVAIVFEDIKEPHILKNQMERIYSAFNLRYDFFQQRQDAFSWLARLGYAPKEKAYH